MKKSQRNIIERIVEGGLIIVVFILCMLLFSSVDVDAIELDGVATILCEIDPHSDSDLNVDLSYLSLKSVNNTFEIYAIHRAQLDTFYIEEAFIKFTKYGLDFSLGRIIQPFGITKLSRPETSVFTSISRYDRISESLNTALSLDILNITSSYAGNGDVTFNVLFPDILNGLSPSIGYTNSAQLTNTFGHWVFANEFLLNTLYVNASVLSEWMPVGGNFWCRSVITPGSYTAIGLLGAYYNTVVMDETLGVWSDTDSEVWTYGLFVDLSKDTFVSIEFRSTEQVLPASIYCVTKF